MKINRTAEEKKILYGIAEDVAQEILDELNNYFYMEYDNEYDVINMIKEAVYDGFNLNKKIEINTEI